jgi:hypothetical protein
MLLMGLRVDRQLSTAPAHSALHGTLLKYPILVDCKASKFLASDQAGGGQAAFYSPSSIFCTVASLPELYFFESEGGHAIFSGCSSLGFLRVHI